MGKVHSVVGLKVVGATEDAPKQVRMAAKQRKPKRKETPKPSPEQKKQLRECESAIQKGADSFLPMCEAFKEIREKDLWKDGKHKSFQSYCRERWVLEPHEVSRFIKAAEVVADLKELNLPLPSNGGQCRVLGILDSKQRREVWNRVLQGEKKPTAQLIQEVATKAGYLTAPPIPTKEAPPLKEKGNYLSTFIQVATSMEVFAESVPELADDEAEKVRTYLKQMRATLNQIEAALKNRTA